MAGGHAVRVRFPAARTSEGDTECNGANVPNEQFTSR